MAAGANSSPAIPPISNNPSAQPHSAAANQQQLSSSNSPVQAFISAISKLIFGLANSRPWSEVFDLSAFSKPESLSQATLRLWKNCNYFCTNYLTIITAFFAFLLLTNPFFLLSGLLAAFLVLYVFRQSSDQPIFFFGHQFSYREALFFLIVSTFGVILLTSVRSVLVSAFMIGVAIVSLHGAFRAPEDLFINEQEPQSGVPGLLTLLNVGAVVG